METPLEWYVEDACHDPPWCDPALSPSDVLVAGFMLQGTSAWQILGVYDTFASK